MSDDEIELRRRLSLVSENRPALEEAAKSATESLAELVGEAALLARRAEAGEDVGDTAATPRKFELTSKIAKATAEAVKELNLIEAHLRQGIAQLTAERQAAAATRAAHSAALAAWAVVIATLTSVLVTLGVAIWDRAAPTPAPTVVVQTLPST